MAESIQSRDNDNTCELVASPLQASRLIGSACNQMTSIISSISEEQSGLKKQMNQVMSDLTEAKNNIDSLVLSLEELSLEQQHHPLLIQALKEQVESQGERITKIEKDHDETRRRISEGYYSMASSRQTSQNDLYTISEIHILEET